MIGNRLCAFALATAFAILCFAAPATASQYDGSWNMVLVTTNGHCGVINIGMAVNGGHISATSGKFVMHKIALAGLISGSGHDQDQWRGWPAPGHWDRTLHEGEGRRQVERDRTWRRSGVCLGVRPRRAEARSLHQHLHQLLPDSAPLDLAHAPS